MNEQDKAAMEEATVRTAQEEALFSNERSAFRMGFTYAIEYRDSLTCEWELDAEELVWLPVGCPECDGFFLDVKPSYGPGCGRRVVTK